MTAPQPALAVALHDPQGKLAGPIETHAETLSQLFSTVAVNLSTATSEKVVAALANIKATRLTRHKPEESAIGRFRRESIALVLDQPSVFYTDLDHLLRWIEADIGSLSRTLSSKPNADMLVIGRSERAFSAEPERLQQTERLVNHVHALITGEQYDLMFAMRRMTADVARMIVETSKVDSLANDAEWPLRARALGFRVEYTECDALYYRTLEDYGRLADTLDDDPLQWIRRIEFAAQHAAAMREFL
ncbi:hypothetical protein GCM10007989_03850 [Devosia pacifica]|uniref:Uncharacterized protein n=1 Tax=Devosia pacifica TaxID=1335967 RepID=A0A918RVD0_9HYPH|nr:hypothetical protein [Devosia pacifica]GHA12606.1 hypothetical protein GCM10007989_03850 [Devosia pacifica]